ncbi:hypothetical protein COLO4_04910 [Corchorus olitorius]|uniref:Uncharacterized protein n=1 Tax=Corchorus olitorius TaxID=93759 RepID=A0A1R3KSG2_9ROSI|nr:hypothetical protein COLO4_04910 [Corchorus olitorius]
MGKPSDKVPTEHFRDMTHKMRYDHLVEFKLVHAKTFDWESLSQNLMYAGLHSKLARMNWLGITKFDQTLASDSMAREFFTGIITDKKKIPKGGREDNVYAFVCGGEVTISANTLGQMLDIEYSEGNSSFIRHNLWFNDDDQDCVTLNDMWILYCIWKGIKVNLAQILINEMKEIAMKEKMICGYGIIIAMLGKSFLTMSHEHEDFRMACSHLLNTTMLKKLKISVDTSAKDAEILKILQGLRNDIREVTRAQNKLTKESKLWRDEITNLMVLLTEKVTGKNFGADIIARVMGSSTASKDIVNLSSSDNSEKKSEEDKEPGEAKEANEGDKADSDSEEKIDEDIEVRTEGSTDEAETNTEKDTPFEEHNMDSLSLMLKLNPLVKIQKKTIRNQ